MPNRVLLAAAGRPAIQRFITKRSLTKRVADRFVAGESLDDAMRAMSQLGDEGIAGILDYLGENVNTEAQADAAANAYIESLHAISETSSRGHVSVKLTQLGLDASTDGALARMQKICARASEIDSTVAIDMESHEYTDSTIDVYRSLRATQDNVVLCLQAYLKRTLSDIEELLPLDPSIRLCKGAYNEPKQIAYAKEDTQRAYKHGLDLLLRKTSYTAVATHDDSLIEHAKRTLQRSEQRGDLRERKVEFQMLYGVRRQLQRQLVEDGYAVRVYIPFGDQWYPYLMRRLAERPANLRFFLEALAKG